MTKVNNNSTNNNYEPDVEFAPTSCTTRSGTYIATGTADDTHHASSFHYSTSHPVVAEELTVYRSKCHIDDIPEMARGLTWNDPFYDSIDQSDTSTDIIAAFDIDRTLFDRSTYDIFKWFILSPTCFLIFYILLRILIDGYYDDRSDNGFVVLLYIMYCSGLSTLYFLVDCQRRESRSRLHCTHIAISTRGIYIDQVESPGSYNLMCRTRIKFDEIKKCQVISEYQCINRTMNYKITINTKDDREIKTEKDDGTNSIFIPRFTIQGIRKQQKFVDIVNVMMERNVHLDLSPAVDSELVELRVAHDVDGLLQKTK